MSKTSVRSATINALKKELRRLSNKYKQFDIDKCQLVVEGWSINTKKLWLRWDRKALWVEGEELRIIEKNILVESLFSDKILGFRTKIVCKLNKIEGS